MDDLELPSDWGASRRATQAAGEEDTPLPDAPSRSSAPKEAANTNKHHQGASHKRRNGRHSGSSKRHRAAHAAQGAPPDAHASDEPPTAASSSQQQQQQQPQPELPDAMQQSPLPTESADTLAVLQWGVSPLGPRSVFDATTSDAPTRGQLRDMVLANLTRDPAAQSHTPQRKEAIDVECLLCKLPYKKMLSDLYGNAGCTGVRVPQIQYVTRAYEESFMREPVHPGERKCAKGKLCECMAIDAEHPFVAVEFLLPGERPPPTPHMCVLCCRAVTQQLYYDVMFDKQDFGGVIQRFGNIHSQPGEYALDAMLIAAPNAPVHVMPLPIVAHQRNRYSVYLQGGIKYLKQSRVYFQDTPS